MLAPGFSVHARRPLQWLLSVGCTVQFADDYNPLPSGATRYSFSRFPGFRGERFVKRAIPPKYVMRFSDYLSIARLWILWKRGKADVTHVHWLDRRAWFCIRAGISPLVVTIWGSDLHRHFLPDADETDLRLARRTLAHTDIVTVDSRDLIEKCMQLGGPSTHVTLLPQGIDTKLFKPGYGEEACALKYDLYIPQAARVIMSIRAWQPMYNHHLILEAFARARSRVSGPVVLLFRLYNLVSYDPTGAGTYEAGIRRRAQELGVEDAVYWMPEVPANQLPVVYALSNLIVNFPAHDAFPVTFLEAAACERPVVTCWLPAYEDTLAEDMAHKVEPGNVAELADAFVTLLTETAPDLEALGRLRARVVEDYDLNVVGNRLLNLYRDLTDSSRSIGEISAYDG